MVCGDSAPAVSQTVWIMPRLEKNTLAIDLLTAMIGCRSVGNAKKLALTLCLMDLELYMWRALERTAGDESFEYFNVTSINIYISNDQPNISVEVISQ